MTERISNVIDTSGHVSVTETEIGPARPFKLKKYKNGSYISILSNKWNNSKFLQKNVAAPLKIALDRCGLLFKDIGNTYQSDHIVANGSVPESALDHVYSSKSLEDKIEVKKLSNGSSDHNPVAVSIHKHPCLRLLMNKLLTYLLT